MFRMLGASFRGGKMQGSVDKVQGSCGKVQGSGVKVQGSGGKVQVSGGKVQGSGQANPIQFLYQTRPDIMSKKLVFTPKHRNNIQLSNSRRNFSSQNAIV